VNEKAESFPTNATIQTVVKAIPPYDPMKIPVQQGRPCLPSNQHYNPLQLFLLFFDWDLIEDICNQTNSFAERTKSDTSSWRPVTKIELLHYFGCLIRIGLYSQQNQRYLYNPAGGCLSGCPLSKNRFEQITKYIHFKDRGENAVKGEDWWLKLGTAWTTIKAKCPRYWIPGSNLTVDEVMIKFEGRSSQIINIPAKPIPLGFKLEALADRGYILNWEATRPGRNEGGQGKIHVPLPEDVDSTLDPCLTNTQAIVARLATTLNPYLSTGRRFHFYLDNLFVCWRLCSYLKGQGIAVTGTCRKGACGIPPRLLALKGASIGLKWGALQVSIVHEVACFLWQDQSAVLGTYLFILLYYFS